MLSQTRHAEELRRYKARQDPVAYQVRHRQYRLAWARRNREKANAHQAVAWAIKTGRLIRPDTCAHCGDACRPEASHDDYTRRLDVEWLCRACHATKDAVLRANRKAVAENT